MKKIVYLLVLFFCTLQLQAYNYTNYYNDGTNTFKMWVPPTTNNVRGLFIVLNQMIDNTATDSLVRLACSVEDIAIIYVYNTTDTAVLIDGLSQLAIESGFAEVANAPFMTIGHSAAGIFAKDLAYYYPERCFGVVQFNAVDYQPPSGVTTGIDSIPFMSIKHMDEPTGDTWIDARNAMLTNYRSKDYFCHLISQPGGGHFGWTQFGARFISMFLQKAAHYQIPYGTYATSGTVKLNRMAKEEGWLTDTTLTTSPVYQPAPFDHYNGNKAEAYWHLDGEIASLWLTLHRQEYNKQPQTVTQTNFSCAHPWITCTPDLQLGVDDKIDFGASASSGLPLNFLAYYGVYNIKDDGAYLDAARLGIIKDYDWVTIYQEGNDTYRYAETQARVRTTTKSGTSQLINFTDIVSKNINDAPYTYDATATSGDPTDYYVASGAIERQGSDWVIQDFSAQKSNVLVFYGQPGNATYASVTGISDQYVIMNGRSGQTIDFTEISDKQIDDPDFTLSATATSGDAVSYKIFSGPASLSANTVSLTGDTGVIVIMAYVEGNATYNGAKAVQYVNVKDKIINVKPLDNLSTNTNIWPVPTDNVINITVQNNTGQIKATLYNVSGTTVLTDRFFGNTEIDVSKIPAGFYIIEITDGSSTQKEKILIR